MKSFWLERKMRAKSRTVTSRQAYTLTNLNWFAMGTAVKWPKASMSQFSKISSCELRISRTEAEVIAKWQRTSLRQVKTLCRITKQIIQILRHKRDELRVKSSRKIQFIQLSNLIKLPIPTTNLENERKKIHIKVWARLERINFYPWKFILLTRIWLIY